MATAATAVSPRPPASRPLIGRRWDWIIIPAALMLSGGAALLTNMLTVGDWSFWIDWKDRQWWALLTPAINIIIPAAFQYIAWQRLRVPVGATFSALGLVGAQWLSRGLSFDWWTNIPINFTFPETMLFCAILLDVTLLLSRSYILTAVFGGMLWGSFFWFFNWPLIAPYMQPVDFQGYTMTVADVMGYRLIRTSTPEYIRIIEEGHLRALLSEITVVVSFFAGQLCIATYFFGLGIGKFLGVLPSGRFFRLGTD